MTRGNILSHLIIKAGAGTGKTWTVTEGIYPMMHTKRRKEVPPSEEQQAVWDAMAEDEYPCPIHMTSFTTDASQQLEDKCPLDSVGKPMVSSSSTYGMGLGYAKRAGQAGHIDIYGHKYKTLTTECLGKSRYELKDDKPGLWDAIVGVQAVARLALKKELTAIEWKRLADHFGIEWTGAWVDDAIAVTNAVLKAGRENLGKYDFTDMVYLPVIQGLVTKKYSTLVVDEFQDMGRAQQELCLLAGWRLILIGDPHQAIYGFAGADQDAFDRLENWLGMTQKGVKVLPLNMTRRCSKAVTHQANKIVPELRHLPEAPEGSVIFCGKGEFYSEQLPKLLVNYKGGSMKSLDFMVICPTNAPLISLMFKLKKKGVNSYVHGKDITASMVSFVNKFDTLKELRFAVDAKIDALLEKKRSRTTETQIDTTCALKDICAECSSKDQVLASINNCFSDVPRNGWLRLSSIHKAKGLEAKKIVLWEVDRCKSKFSTLPWQHQSDINLEYVGITRAINTLIAVKS